MEMREYIHTYSSTPQAAATIGGSEEDENRYESVTWGGQVRDADRIVSEEAESREHYNEINHDTSVAVEASNLPGDAAGHTEPYYMNQSQITLAQQQYIHESS